MQVFKDFENVGLGLIGKCIIQNRFYKLPVFYPLLSDLLFHIKACRFLKTSGFRTLRTWAKESVLYKTGFINSQLVSLQVWNFIKLLRISPQVPPRAAIPLPFVTFSGDARQISWLATSRQLISGENDNQLT